MESNIVAADNVAHGGFMSWFAGKTDWKTVFGFFAKVPGIYSLLSFFGINVATQNGSENQITSDGQQSMIRGINWKNVLRTTAEATGAVKRRPKVYMGGLGAAHQSESVDGPVEINVDYGNNYRPPPSLAISPEDLQDCDTIMVNTGPKAYMKTAGSLKMTSKYE